MDNRLITSRSDFQQAVRDGLAEMAASGCRQVWVSDPDFADWPWSERESVEQLQRWALSHRQMSVVALHFEGLVRTQARWVSWRRQWAHVVSCRVAADQDAATLPVMLLAPGLFSLRLTDKLHWRGKLSVEPRDEALALEEIDAVMQRAAESFPAHVLGL